MDIAVQLREHIQNLDHVDSSLAPSLSDPRNFLGKPEGKF